MVGVFYQKKVFNNIALFYKCVIILVLFTFPGIVLAQSSVATLSGLTISPTGNFAFDGSTTYTGIKIPSGTTQISVQPTLTDNVNGTVAITYAGATLGSVAASSGTSSNVPLSVGANVITITVTAQDGTTQAYILNIYVPSNDDKLQSLGISSGSFTFDPNASSFYVTVPNSTSTITLQPTVDVGSNATVTVKNLSVTSGSQSTGIDLTAGVQLQIPVTVTAEDLVTSRTYTVYVTRLKPNINTLSKLTISPGSISYDGSTTYSPSVPVGTTAILVTPTADDPLATIALSYLSGGSTVSNGVTSGVGISVPLIIGTNAITITVTAQDGSTNQYTLNVTRPAPSNIAWLNDLQLNGFSTAGNLILNGVSIPGFIGGANPSTTTYTINEPNAVSNFSLIPVMMDTTARASVNGGPALTSGTVSSPLIHVTSGSTVSIPVIVTAQDNSTKTYTVNIYRQRSPNATLNSLSINGTAITPIDTTNHSVITGPNQTNATSSISVLPLSTSTLVKLITVRNTTNNTTQSGSYNTTFPVTLAYGNNVITITILAQDSTSTHTYTLNVLRQLSTVASLHTLNVSSGVLSPSFVADQISASPINYTDSLSYSTSNITLTPTSTFPLANFSVTSNGNTLSAPYQVSLNPGNTQTIIITDTAQDKSTIQIYNVNIKWKLSNVATLDSLAIAGVPLSGFSKTQTQYTAPNVSFSTASVAVRPRLTDVNAQSIVINNGYQNYTGTNNSSTQIPLTIFGINTLTITVTAQNGSSQIYTVYVNRLKSSDAKLSGLGLNGSTNIPNFNPDTTTYTVNVGYGTMTATVTPTNLNNATITVGGQVVASGSASQSYTLVTNTIVPIAVNVQSQDLVNTNTYTVKVFRQPSNDSTLSSLTVAGTPLTGLGGNNTYNISVSNTTQNVLIIPALTDIYANSLTINGTAVSNNSSNTINLTSYSPSVDVIRVVVTSWDKKHTTTYTINVTRALSTVNTLSNLAVSSGSLGMAGFSPTVYNYTDSLANNTTSLTLTSQKTDNNSTVAIALNGTPITYATSALIDLTNKLNTTTTVPLTITVTSQSGVAQVYTINLILKPSSSAKLTGLTVSAGNLSPSFAVGNTQGTTNYKDTVTSTTNSITVTGTAIAGSSILVNNGANGSSVPLGFNTPGTFTNIPILVTAPDGVSTASYTLSVYRPLSSEARLKSLTLVNGSTDYLASSFSPSKFKYPVVVAYTINSLTLTPTILDNNANLYINNALTSSGAPFAINNLTVGLNTVYVKVVSQDFSTILIDTLQITRQGNNDASLSTLTLNGSTNFTLTPAGANTYTATFSVPNNGTPLAVVANANDLNALVTINNNFAANANTASIPLIVGNNTVTIKTTAQDGVTTITDIITVNRAASKNDLLRNLTTNNNGTWTPTFDSLKTSYTVNVTNSVGSISFFPTLADTTASIKINGSTAVNKLGFLISNLNVGSNSVVIKVTAQSGDTLKYNITVIRAGAAISTLSNLTVNPGSITSFTSANLYYTVNVSGSTANIVITPTASDPNATVKVNNVTVPYGSSSGQIQLNLNANTIPIIVKAQDLVDSTTYTLTVNRIPNTDATLKTLSSSGGGFDGTNTTFSSGNLTYHQTVLNGVTSIQIKAVATDSLNASVSINGGANLPYNQLSTQNLSVGDNVFNILVTAQDGSKKTYSLTVHRNPSVDLSLLALTYNYGSGNITPTDFVPNVQSLNTTYQNQKDSVSSSVSTITITAKLNVLGSTITINGSNATSGSPSVPITLYPGANPITILVSNSGTTSKTTLYIYKQYSNEARLSSLNVTPGTYLPNLFSSDIYKGYTDTITNDKNSVTITATAKDAANYSYISINGNSNVLSGSPFNVNNLSVGDNSINIVVAAGNVNITKTYNLDVYRKASSNSTLSSILVTNNTDGSTQTVTSPSNITPTIISSGITYQTSSLTFALSIDNNATATINGINAVNNTGTVTLNYGLNTIPIKVIAQDKSYTTYTIQVTRPQSTVSTLSDLQLIASATHDFTNSPISVKASLDANKDTINVANKDSIIYILAQTIDQNATIKVNQNSLQSGVKSNAVSLNVGINIINVLVTAQSGDTTNYNIEVIRQQSTDASISKIAITYGTTVTQLTQSDPSTYTATVDNSVTSITVTPTTTDPNTIIKVDSYRALSGQATTQSFSLNPGITYITVDVTAQDHKTTLHYFINVTRNPSSNADLSGIGLSSGTLTPKFSATQNSYTATVSNGTTSITITPTTVDGNATILVSQNSAPVPSGTGATVTLGGTGTYTKILIKTTSQDSLVTKTDTINIFRQASSNTLLSSLNTDYQGSNKISPNFDAAKTNYSLYVENGINTIIVEPRLQDNTSTFTVNNGTVLHDGSFPAAITLTPGVADTIPIKVTAQDGITTLTYNLVVTEQGNTVTSLNQLNIISNSTYNNGIPVYQNSKDTIAFPLPSVYLDYRYNSVTIQPYAKDPTASVYVNNKLVSAGNVSSPVALNIGPNKVNIKVIAQDKVHSTTNTLTIGRKGSSDATLLSLTTNRGTLGGTSPNYTLTVDYGISTIAITPTLNDTTADVTVNGTVVLNGTPSKAYNLNVGDNKIPIVVTASDTVDQATYSITVTRSTSSISTLSNLSLDQGITLSPSFNKDSITYKVRIPNSISSLNVTPTASNDTTETIQVNGSSVASKAQYLVNNLFVGSNTINTVVTAQNGTTTTYKIIVSRDSSSNDTLNSVTLTSTDGTLPAFDFSKYITNKVTYQVTNGIKSISIFPTAKDNINASVFVNGNNIKNGNSYYSTLSVGTNAFTIQVVAQNGQSNTYTLNIARDSSKVKTLLGLVVNNNNGIDNSVLNFTTNFVPSDTNYTNYVVVNQPYSVSSITITPTLTDGTASIKLNNATSIASGTASGSIPLNVGNNTVSLLIKAQSGDSLRYTVNIRRLQDTISTLSDLALSYNSTNLDISTEELAANNTFIYNVPNNATTISVMPTATATTSKVYINGNFISQNSSTNISLNVDTNIIRVNGIAQNDTNNTTYTVKLVRKRSTIVTLDSLTVSWKTQEFQLTKITDTTFSAPVGNLTDSVVVTAYPTDPTAQIKVNSNLVYAKTPSAPIYLSVGNNQIISIVVAQDGIAKRTYTIGVNRDGSSIAIINSLTVSGGGNPSITPTSVSSDLFTYNYSVPYTTDSVQVKASLADTTAGMVLAGQILKNNTLSWKIPINAGASTTINDIVTSQNAKTINTYHIIINRTGSAQDTLANLTSSVGTLQKTGTLTYFVSVDNSTSTINFRPFQKDQNATVIIAGGNVTYNTLSSSIPIYVGNNIIPIYVKAQSGRDSLTYTVTVYRAPSTNLFITNLEALDANNNNIILTSFGGPTITNYQTSPVDNSVKSINITVITADSTQTIKINNNPVPLLNGNASSPVNLNIGENTINVLVTAQDTNYKIPYTIKITRAQSGEARMDTIVLNNGTLKPSFNKDTINYTVHVPFTTKSIIVTPTVIDPNTQASVNGVNVNSGSPSNAIQLNVGSNNKIDVNGTAQNFAQFDYYITVIRDAGSAIDSLSDLKPSTGQLSPSFAESTRSYSVSVPFETSNITFTPTTTDINATYYYQFNNIQYPAGTNFALNPGNNEIDVIVTAQNGNDTSVYAVIVNRKASDISTLDSLTLSAHGKPIATNPAKINGYDSNYAATVDFYTKNVNVTPTLTDAKGTVTVNGVLVNSGSASNNIALDTGSNRIEVKGIAQDGNSTTNYLLLVYRSPGSAIDTLSSLAVNPGKLSPDFTPNNTSYTVREPLAFSSITITPTLADTSGTYIFNYKSNTNISATNNTFNLDIGANTIEVVVTAQNNTYTKTYTVNVNRIPSDTSTLNNITFNNGVTFSTKFNSDNLNYIAYAAYNTDNVTITPTLTDVKGTVTVNGSQVVSGTASGSINLNIDTNLVTVVGTAENGIAQSTYTLKIVRGRSGDATLSTIMLNGTAISGFAPNDTLYTQTVDNSNTSTGISALTTIDGASLFINDTSYAPGTLHKINLKIGKNLVYLKVISQDTKSTKTYTLEIDRLLEAQAFTFPAIPTKTAVDPDFPAGAKVNTGLPIVYKSSDETVATVSSSGMVHLLDTGSTTITASINASPLDSAYYNQYKPISQVLKVTRAQQTITGFTFPKLYKDSIYVLDNVKTNAVGLQVQFTSSDSSLVKVDKIYPDTNDKTRYFSVLKALEFGQVTITASQDGNKLYLPATSLALTINVEDPGGPDLKVVQAVTPNGDGMNDVLKIYGIDNYTNNSVTIYNPYGVRVYSEKNYDNITRVFDGHSNITGKFLPAGTYFYFIKYLKGSESKQATGYIVLKY